MLRNILTSVYLTKTMSFCTKFTFKSLPKWLLLLLSITNI